MFVLVVFPLEMEFFAKKICLKRNLAFPEADASHVSYFTSFAFF